MGTQQPARSLPAAVAVAALGWLIDSVLRSFCADPWRVREGGAVPEEAHGLRQARPSKRGSPRPCVRVRGERHLQNVHRPAESKACPREEPEVREGEERDHASARSCLTDPQLVSSVGRV